MRHDLPHKVNPAAAALIQGRLHDPLIVLGAHGAPGAAVYRVFRPDAARAWLNTGAAYEPMRRVHDAGLFEWKGAQSYRLLQDLIPDVTPDVTVTPLCYLTCL